MKRGHTILELPDDLPLFARGKKLLDQLEFDERHMGLCARAALDLKRQS